MAEQDSHKAKYTLLLSIAFIGIGGWKLYDKFGQDKEMASYQWILGAGLVILGIYQLFGLWKARNNK